jgi:hypothetical protein
MSQNGWLYIAGEPQPGLEAELHGLVNGRIARHEFRQDAVEYISKVDFSLVRGRLLANEQEMAIIRRLCQSWDVELRPFQITSHRPVLGKFIVALKKLAYPILRVFLKDLIKQQRDFNAASLALLGRVISQRAASEPTGLN